MITQYTQVTTISRDIIFPSLYDEIEKVDTSRHFKENIGSWSEFGFTAEMMVGSIISVRELETPEIPEPSTRNTSASLELNFGGEIESGVTQEFAGIQPQVPAFPFYNEEDILNLDAVIDTPPPRLSRTIRVKLIYEEPSEPIPVEDPWK